MERLRRGGTFGRSSGHRIVVFESVNDARAESYDVDIVASNNKF